MSTGLVKRISEAKMTKALLGEKDDADDDSVNTPKEGSDEESMFGNDVNKKVGKPVRGYRWMCFTFTMILALSITVIFNHDISQIAK